MYERFTDRARKVMQLAKQEAQRCNHEYMGTEHLLVGLIKERSGVATNVLKNLDIDLRKVRVEIEKIVQPSSLLNSSQVVGELLQTPRLMQVIQFTLEEARLLGVNWVGTEHLLLGILRVPECPAVVLQNLGTKLETVREEIMLMLGLKEPEPIVVLDIEKPKERLIDLNDSSTYKDGEVPETDVEVCLKVLRTAEQAACKNKRHKVAEVVWRAYEEIVKTCEKHNEEFDEPDVVPNPSEYPA